MSKTKELLEKLNRHEPLEGELNKLKEHYLNIEQQYYENFRFNN